MIYGLMVQPRDQWFFSKSFKSSLPEAFCNSGGPHLLSSPTWMPLCVATVGSQWDSIGTMWCILRVMKLALWSWNFMTLHFTLTNHWLSCIDALEWSTNVNETRKTLIEIDRNCTTSIASSSTRLMISKDSGSGSWPWRWRIGANFFPIRAVGVSTSSYDMKIRRCGIFFSPKIIRARVQKGQRS